MKNRFQISLLIILLPVFLFACSLIKPKPLFSNLRMALDQDGANVTSIFAPSDTIFAVADLNDAPKGTLVVVKWIAIDVEGLESNLVFQEQTMEVPEDNYSKSIYFQVSVANAWPVGSYMVEMYLNGTLSQMIKYNVQ